LAFDHADPAQRGQKQVVAARQRLADQGQGCVQRQLGIAFLEPAARGQLVKQIGFFSTARRPMFQKWGSVRVPWSVLLQSGGV